MRYFICLFILIFLFLPAHAEETDCKAYLKEGKIALDNSQYKEAIERLSETVKGCAPLDDYALFWLSEAYHDIGNYKESLKVIRDLLNNYQDTPLIKQARMREITEASEISEENIEKLYESYIIDYPHDQRMKYLYAKFLIQNGNNRKAKEFFKDLYISAGPYSSAAFNELKSDDISPEDIIERSSNLIDHMQYKRAEDELRAIIIKDDKKLQNQIYKNLGISLFKQKKYKEAAEIFAKAHERYWEIRSLYRAGEKETVNSSLKELLENGDSRMASILISLAADRRREGKIDEALSLYQDIIEKYPSESEDALWGIGWTYYLTGAYDKSSEIFTKLYDTYKDSRYLYWYARSIEVAGGDAKQMYHSLIEKGRNFYGAMIHVKGLLSSALSEHEKIKLAKDVVPVTKNTLTEKKNERIDTLFSIGFSKEALIELNYLAKNPGSIEDVLYACNKFNELKEYRYSVGLAVKVPYNEKMHPYLYPLAYLEIIESFAKKYDIDPLIVLSIVREESRFNPEAKSPAGAIGLMQLMPSTAKRFDSILKININNMHDIFDVEKNLKIGIYYLNYLIKEFGSYAYAIAAYNAGEQTVKRWTQNSNYKSVDEFIEDIPYIETKNYVKRVINTFFEYALFSPAGVRNKAISFEML